MNGFDQDSLALKRRSWQLIDHQEISRSSSHQSVNNGAISTTTTNNYDLRHHDDLVSAVVPAVTVVLEGRSICHRISLHKHASYQSLAKALRQMFAGDNNDDREVSDCGDDLDLSNAVPGHLVAYEDMENDLLLAGDLSWKDFVRVAKRIRILPAKSNSRKPRSEGV